MRTFINALVVALCACGAMAQPLTFVSNEPGSGFIDISGTGTPLLLGDDGVAQVAVGPAQGNDLFPGPGVWTVGNNGGMGFNIPPNNQALPAGNALIPSGAGQLGPTFGGIQQALLPGWDDEGDSLDPTEDVFFLIDPVNNMLIVQWNQLPVGNVGDKTTFQVQVPFGSSLLCGVYARFIYTNVENPTVNGGAIFSIGYQDGELGQNNSVNVGFNVPNTVQNGTVLSLTCQRPCFWQTIGCPADYDGDLDTDSDDVVAFFGDWDQGFICADVDRDGDTDADDVAAFFAPWDNGGCD